MDNYQRPLLPGRKFQKGAYNSKKTENVIKNTPKFHMFSRHIFNIR